MKNRRKKRKKRVYGTHCSTTPGFIIETGNQSGVECRGAVIVVNVCFTDTRQTN